MVILQVVTIRTVRVTWLLPAQVQGFWDKSMTQLLLRVWALLSPALSPILRLGMGSEALGRELFSGSIFFRLWVLLHSILILHFPLIFSTFHQHSVPVANLHHIILFGPCQQLLGSKPSGSGWLMICKFKAGTLTWALPFSWSPGPRGTLVMRRWLSHRTYSKSTSLDPLGCAGPCQWVPVGMWVQSSDLERLSMSFLSLCQATVSSGSWSTPSLTQLHTYSSPEKSPTLTPYLHPGSQIRPVSCTFCVTDDVPAL